MTGEEIRDKINFNNQKIQSLMDPSIFILQPEVQKYMEDNGFQVEAFAYSEKLPVLRSVDEETLKRLKVSYAKMIEWRLVPQSEAVVIDPNLPFEVKSEVNDGVFTASIQGRVDTITAPELLTRFQEARSGIKAIHLDVSRMAYISSAGLRVLLMMYKALPDKEQFEMTGVNSEVREILETTGFDQFLLKE